MEELDIFGFDLQREMKEALDLAKRARLEINRARQAGLPVEELLAQLTEYETQLKRLRQVYGTGRRVAGREEVD